MDSEFEKRKAIASQKLGQRMVEFLKEENAEPNVVGVVCLRLAAQIAKDSRTSRKKFMEMAGSFWRLCEKTEMTEPN